ncbi:class I SAM-dependent methyltransferase [Bradyrhizobium sp. BRP14]|nr:class I SAM-dependent methyltransferase [Bradyrhizobium sp. BRP14]
MADGEEHWQLDGSAAELYERYLVPAITSLWAADLIARAQPKAGEAVLDIACGTGVVTRLAARHLGTGRVVGLDLNPGMLAVAGAMASTEPPIEWVEGSALGLPFTDASFDVVLCQLGLQFFPDRFRALREMRRVLVPSGRVALSVYGPIERTPAAFAFAQALDEHLGAGASNTKRAEHIFSEVEELRTLISGAGFDQVEIHTVTQLITFPSVLDYVRFQLTATPMKGLLSEHSELDREAVMNSVASDARSVLLDSYVLGDGRLRFPQEGYVATAVSGAG